MSENAVNSHVFFHPALCMAWIETYMPLRDIMPLFCVSEHDSKIVFMPLVIWKQNWKNAFRRVIVPLGHSDFDYHDPIADNELSTDDWIIYYNSLLSELRSNVSFDAIEISGIRTYLEFREWSKENDIAPFCDLSQFTDHESFLRSVGYNLRRNILKQIRRLERNEPLIFYEYKNADEALSALPHFISLHSARWPGAYKAPGFLNNLVNNCYNNGLIHFTSLQSAGKIMSYHIGFIHNNRYCCYLIAINPEFEYYSPGKIHLFKLIEYAYEKKYKIFDLLRGDENYKAGWTNKYQVLYKLYSQNRSPQSVLRNMCYALRQRVI